MAWSLFGQLDWLTTRVKRLCCAVDKIKESGVGSYKVYTALLYQDGGNPPTATVLENTLGVDLVWQRIGTGRYTAAYDPLGGDCGLASSKVFLIVGGQTLDAAPTVGNVSYAGYFGCIFTIETVNNDNPPASSDGVLWQTPIEIRLYN